MKLTWNVSASVATWNSPQAVWNGNQPDSTKRMNPIALKLNPQTDPELRGFLTDVLAKYQQNAAALPGLTAEVTALTSANTAFDGKLTEMSAAEAALRVVVDQKNAARQAAEAAVTAFANAAAGKVNNDAAILGLVFPLRAEPKSYAELGQVQALSATFGDNPGELDLMWNRLDGARSYEVWLNLTPNTEAGWTLREVSTRSTFTLAGLPRGQTVHVRVRAIGAKNAKGAFSDLVEHIVG